MAKTTILSNEKEAKSYAIIPLTSIVIDPDQPRKASITDADISDLTSSIAASGVIQPIVVRPVKKGKKTTYMIVCGERRYRASINAGTKTIPAIVATLSDDEAREYQIIENLQRKDVHPVEEGNAYKLLSESGKSIAEISLRVGKSTSYVAKRLKLADLTPEWQQIALDDTIDITTAVNLSKMATDYQQQLYEVAKKNGFQHLDWSINNAPAELTEAGFDISDPSLNPAMGACTLCQYNSGNTPMLFDDENESPVCNKPSCFHIKTQAYRSIIISKAQEDPSIILVSHSNKADKEAIGDILELGIPVLTLNDYQHVYDPGPRLTKEEYGKQEYYGDPDEDPEDLDLEYESYKKSHTHEVVEYKQTMATAKKAYVIDGGTIGREVLISINKTDPEDTAPTSGIQEQINDLRKKEERKEFLTAVKMYRAACDKNLLDSNVDFTQLRGTALIMLLAIMYDKVKWKIQSKVQAIIKENTEGELSMVEFTSHLSLHEVKKLIINTYFEDHLFKYQKSEEISFNTNTITAASYLYLQDYFNEDLIQLEAEYEAINDNRKIRLEARIKSLQS